MRNTNKRLGKMIEKIERKRFEIAASGIICEEYREILYKTFLNVSQKSSPETFDVIAIDCFEGKCLREAVIRWNYKENTLTIVHVLRTAEGGAAPRVKKEKSVASK